MENTKIAFVSLGCDKNLVDSQVMLGLIHKEGYKIVGDEYEADIIIVNTCGFIGEATSEAIGSVIDAGSYKEDGNCKALIVTGCMAQRFKDEIFSELPEVDAVVGTGDFEKIGEVIKAVLEGKKVNLVTNIDNAVNEENSENRFLSAFSYFAYLKIAEGCDNRCTYCTIPSLRGKYRSRTLESLVREAKRLAENGVRELILVAQDTALYGKDLYGESKLHLLLSKLSQIEGIEWIRLLYAYPEHLTSETIEEMARNPKVCHYIDMPIQHSDDAILKKMGRRSTNAKLKEITAKLREKMPDIALRTTLIVGFPAESQENFKNLCDFVEEMRFDRLGVFTYSQEEGTPAAIMENQISEEEKIRRKEYILEIQKSISAKLCAEKINKKLTVMVDGKVEGNLYCGRTYADCYEIDGLVFFDAFEDIISGEFREVIIKESSDYDLIGEIYYEPSE